MTTETDRVIMTNEMTHHGSIHATTVRHRDFPEMHCEGLTPEEAADRLAVLLRECLEHSPSEWRREAVERAIEDVREFACRCLDETASRR